jgi:tyrosyl-tRNA synthetase
MNYILPGLIGQKMSSSIPGSKIDMMDSEEEVSKKINKAVCEEGNISNGLLPFLKYVVMVMKEDNNKKLILDRPEKFGGKREYSNYSEIETDFANKKLHPMDLKKIVIQEINLLVKDVRSNKILQKLYKEAYN